MSNPPSLWDKSDAKQPMRLPHIALPQTATNVRAQTEQNPTKEKPRQPEHNYEEVLANTKLKVDAPEWYPPSHNQNSCHTVQDRLQKFRISETNSSTAQMASSYQVQPSGLNEWQKYSDYVNKYSQHHIDEPQDILRLRQLIFSLVSYPGQFDDLLEVFMETICQFDQDIGALAQIVELIVTEAINCSSFRYNAARLCWCVEQHSPTFKAELARRCQQEFQENPNKQNVVLFIAELYSQFPYSPMYSTLLIYSLRMLLDTGGNDNVKCVCQALKLTGYPLDQNNKRELDDLFGKLSIVQKSVSNDTISLLLNSVFNLRQSNWGRVAQNGPTDSELSEGEFDFDDGTNDIVYETSEGNVLTNEEQNFLAAHAMAEESSLSDNGDPDALCNPEPEMTLEIQEAFREFQNLSKR